MDGVPGFSFHGIRPGETFTYRFQLKQAGTYWYHAHSSLQEAKGVYGAIVIEPRDADPVAADRDYVVLLSDWSDEDPHAIVRKLKIQADYYNRHKQTVGDLFRDARRDGWAPRIADRKALGRDAHEPDRPGRRQRHHLHLPGQRRHAGRQLDRPVQARRESAAAFHQRLGDDLSSTCAFPA